MHTRLLQRCEMRSWWSGRQQPPLACVACVLFAGILGVYPFVAEYRLDARFAEADQLAQVPCDFNHALSIGATGISPDNSAVEHLLFAIFGVDDAVTDTGQSRVDSEDAHGVVETPSGG